MARHSAQGMMRQTLSAWRHRSTCAPRDDGHAQVIPDSGNIEMSAPFLPPGADHDELMRQHVEQILKPPPWATGFHRYEEIARMALFLASDESSGCTGGDRPVDGGYIAGRRSRP
jgi:NAD(P)-dependent dehydrogenase (short-subunit alcohol dehydrogenase family)